MRKIIIALAITAITAVSVNATILPDEVKNSITKEFPKANFRFDGVITLPDGTVYLPLIPSKFDKKDEFKIKSTFPAGKSLSQRPDVVIFSNDYVLMRVIVDEKGNRSLAKLTDVPIELRMGLLPQDMLVPANLSIPQNLKNIIGNLEIPTSKDSLVTTPIVQPKTVSENTINSLAQIPELKNKILYVSTSFSKNIQVVNPEKKIPEYALQQNHIPIMIKGYDDRFLLETSYGKRAVDIISLADDKVIKQIELKSQPDEIVMDYNNKLAYISAPDDASIYVLSLETMTLKRQIKLNGMCEKIVLSGDGTKIFYNDKQTNTIWAVELDNEYLLKEIGKFPNVSKIAYVNGKVYITSRTQNRLAIVDYATVSLLSENSVGEKPVDMLVDGDNLFILGASQNSIEVVDTSRDKLTDTIMLPTEGFSTRINKIDGTNLAIVSDAKAGKYIILNLETKAVVAANPIATPVTSIVVANKIKKLGK